MANPEWSTMPGGAEEGIRIKWGGGDMCETKARTTTVEIQCDRSLSKTKAMGGEEQSQCVYVLKFAGPDGCPVSAGGIGGLGSGWTFVIIVFVGFTCYCLGGSIYISKYKGKRGIEAIPHSTFWIQLPQLVQAGCQFTMGKLRSLRKGSADSYGDDYDGIDGT